MRRAATEQNADPAAHLARLCKSRRASVTRRLLFRQQVAEHVIVIATPPLAPRLCARGTTLAYELFRRMGTLHADTPRVFFGGAQARRRERAHLLLETLLRVPQQRPRPSQQGLVKPRDRPVVSHRQRTALEHARCRVPGPAGRLA